MRKTAYDTSISRNIGKIHVTTGNYGQTTQHISLERMDGHQKISAYPRNVSKNIDKMAFHSTRYTTSRWFTRSRHAFREIAPQAHIASTTPVVGGIVYGVDTH